MAQGLQAINSIDNLPDSPFLEQSRLHQPNDVRGAPLVLQRYFPYCSRRIARSDA